MKKLLALVLALVMSMSLVTISNAAFKDADKIDYDEAVEVMNAIGVLVGDEKGNFNAKENLTREQAAKIISYLLLGNKTAEALVGAAKFTDVAATRWSAGFVDYCASTGVVAGNGNGTFAPAGQLTGFQFAKMLLVALGYDAKIEGFTGTDWQINVSKVANQVGLFNGLSISGTAVLTREQGAQMCLNTLKAPLVEYSNKGGSLSVNGAVIEIGASKAQYVTTTLAKEQRISDRTLTNTTTTLNGGYTVEFGEKYYPALELKNDSDDFDRPAHQWLINNKKINSYVDYDLMVAEYTAAVTGKDLYDQLGSSIIKNYEITYYVDGKLDSTIKASNMIKTNTDDYSTTGKGVLTQVFVDDDAKEITIVSINTFAAVVLADYNKTKETLSIRVKDGDVYQYATQTLKLEDFETISEYAKDDVVMITAAEGSNGKYDIQTIATPEKMENKDVTKYAASSSKTSNVVVDGTQYDFGKNGNCYSAAELKTYNKSSLTNYSYNFYLDSYGYVIASEVYEGTANYLFLAGYDLATSYLTVKTADANVILLDGTMSTVKINVTDTNKNIDGVSGYRQLSDTDANANQYNKWFTYSEKDGVYTLKAVAHSFEIAKAKADDRNINCASARLTDDTSIAYGNDDSVYITVKTDKVSSGSVKSGISKVTGTYTGVQNVDLDVTDASKVPFNSSVFVVADDEKYIIGAIVLGEDANSTTNYAYAVKAAQNEWIDGDDNYYWDFKAIVDGEYKTLTVKEKLGQIDTSSAIAAAVAMNKTALFKLTYDKDGYVIEAALAFADSKTYNNTEFVAGTAITDDYNVYDVDFANEEITLQRTGRTLYVTKYAQDVGLTVAKDAPIFVVQKNTLGTLSVESYTELDQALRTLEDADASTENTLEFKGIISAVLNKNGSAKCVIIKSNTAVKVTTDDGTTPATKGGINLTGITYVGTTPTGEYTVTYKATKAFSGCAKWSLKLTTAAGALIAENSGACATSSYGVGDPGSVAVTTAKRAATDINAVVTFYDANGNVIASAEGLLAV